MPAPRTTTGRARFVLLSQQTLALAAVGAVALSAAGVVQLEIVPPQPASTATAAGAASGALRPGPGVSLVSAAPVEPTVRTVPFGGTIGRQSGGLSAQVHGRAGAHSGTDGDGAQQISATSPPERATGYATVGVTWSAGATLGEDDITVSVRTKRDGAWSGWQQMAYDPEHEPDPGSAEAERAAVPGTDAVVVGDVDDVQVRAATTSGTAPAGLALAIVDPGKDVRPTYEAPAIDTADLPPDQTVAPDPQELAREQASLSAASTGTTTPSPTTTPAPTTGPDAVTPKPVIFSRKQWGADEALRDPSSLHYGEIHAGFVHHTVNSNDYDRGDVPSILRGIYAYHTQSRGWSDVGYNFLVDRFGQIWEGRYGGVGRPVVGAHTLGYNDDSFAMSAIGNYDIAKPSKAMINAYARLFAWKLGLHGVRADDTRQFVTSRTFQAINGHRDAGSTACPGRYLYARIPDIRVKAAALQRSFAARDRQADLGGSSWPDFVLRDKATHHAVVVRTAGQLRFGTSVVAADDWRGKDLVVPVGDLDHDGVTDVLARDAATGSTSLYPGNGNGGLGAPAWASSRFAGVDQLTGVGDFDGDGRPDVVGRRNGALLLWRGTAGGGFTTARALARDWSSYDLTVGVDDFDEDGHPDLVARSGRTLFLVPGTGRGLEAPVRLTGGWRGYLVAGRGDVSGDGHPDLLVRDRNGVTWVVPGDGAGGLQPRIGGWQRYAKVRSLALGQLDGGRRPEVIAFNATRGTLRVSPNSGRRNLGRTVDTGITLDRVNLLLNVGDWNGDGRGDFMVRRRGGSMWLYAGAPHNRFAAPVRAARDWRGTGHVTAAGDVTGDGYPDLTGTDSAGNVRIYPSNGRSGFHRSYVAHSPVDGDRQVGVGLFNGDGAPDTVVRHTDGTLWLWSGNGPGGLVDSRQVGTDAGGYDWLRGYGDVDGRGRTDLVARSRGTGDLWLLPGTRKGFGERRLIGTGFDAYDLMG